MLTFQVTEVENGFAVIILPTDQFTPSKTFVFTSRVALFAYLSHLIPEASESPKDFATLVSG